MVINKGRLSYYQYLVIYEGLKIREDLFNTREQLLLNGK